MDTIHNVGDTVYIEAKVKEIYVDEKGIQYMCTFRSVFGETCKPIVGLGTLSIKEGSSNAET